jgi:hypothetical protein
LMCRWPTRVVVRSLPELSELSDRSLDVPPIGEGRCPEVQRQADGPEVNLRDLVFLRLRLADIGEDG